MMNCKQSANYSTAQSTGSSEYPTQAPENSGIVCGTRLDNRSKRRLLPLRFLCLLAAALFGCCGCASVMATAQNSELGSITCSNPAIAAPGTANCDVNMTGAAPYGLGIHVTSNNAAVTPPAWVVVPTGSTSEPFSAQIGSGVSGTVVLTGTFNGISKSTQLQIGSTTSPIALSAITCTSTSVLAPSTVGCSVALQSAAPSSGVIVQVASNSGQVLVPISILVPAGATTAAFSANVSSGAPTVATLTANLNGTSKSIQLQIASTSSYSELGSLACSASSVASPGSTYCQVNMTGVAPAGGLGVHLTSSTAGAAVPAWVVVPQGASTAGFTTSVASGLPAETVTLTATFNQVFKSAQFQIGSSTTSVSVAVSPSSATVLTGAQQQFAATVSGTSNTAVTWTISGAGCSGASCGTISPTGLFTAPTTVPSSGTVAVRATAQQDTTKSAVANVSIAAPQASASVGATYYMAPAGAGGNDRNDGLSASAPWLTPNHSLNCGDTILAASGTYDAQNFMVGSWGAVSCPSANNVAWLKCTQFDGCHISTNSMSAGMWIDRSFWGVQGWEITTQKAGAEPTCFVVAPNWNNPVEVDHVILANNIANGCQAGGISTANHPGTSIGVDYLAIVGNIAYNSTQGSSECYTGISVYAPMASDSQSGTHIYLAGNFAWDNWDPDYCAGGPATDGEGLMFDEVDASNQNLPAPTYSQQMVADNNILIGNGGPGLQVDHNNYGSGPWATIYTRHNTLWGNNHDQTLSGIHGEMLWGTVQNTHSSFDLAVTNIQTGGGAYPVNGYMVSDSPGASNISTSWAYSPWGDNIQVISSSGFSAAFNNTFGVDPQLTNPSVPGAPSCAGKSNVPACMSTLIASFTPKNSSAKAYGYQIPSVTPAVDALFPKWLCSVTNFPSGLVTMGCAQ